MIKKLSLVFLSMVALHSAALAQTFNGNGLTGFGGTMGNANLVVTESGNTINFTYNTGGAIGNNSVFYIDSVAGGFSDTSLFTDDTDGGRRATSGFYGSNPNAGNAATRTLATFASGFTADYALVVGNGFAVVFQLASGAAFNVSNEMNFASPNTNQYTFSISLADIGLSLGQGFSFVGTLVSDTAYRSNETFGASVTTPGTPADSPNSGFNGSTTFSNFLTVVPVPEPSSLALLVAPAIFGAYLLRRKKLIFSSR